MSHRPKNTEPGPLASGFTFGAVRTAATSVPSAAGVCLTPKGKHIRVGVVIGGNESSVVLDYANARAYADMILAHCNNKAE